MQAQIADGSHKTDAYIRRNPGAVVYPTGYFLETDTSTKIFAILIANLATAPDL
jgi:hypothetical protein